MLLVPIMTRIEEERGRFLMWVPVFLGSGVGIYFSLRFEPPLWSYIWLVLAMFAALLTNWRWPWGLGPVALAFGLVCAGVTTAGFSAHFAKAPVLGFRYYGPVDGRIVKIDRSQSDAMRLTLDQVKLEDVKPARVPKRVRVSLHGEKAELRPEVGQRLQVTAHLGPPSGPVEPGGFDFQRMAWFMGIGAVGYSRSPATLSDSADHDPWLDVARLRHQISVHVRSVLPGSTGAFAAAITTGDRSAMDRETLTALRQSNLAHLLAISGLHMGLLTGFIFQAIRILLSLLPRAALRLPVKKLAACLAILGGAFYLALSGGNVATERAFIMVATMFTAILFDRRALTLRAVAMAAVIVLILRPQALIGPGFQMSFAATTALVAVFGALRAGPENPLPKWVRAVFAVVLSSFVAGLATAPFAAAHFNQVSHYGLVANIMSVPLMGAVIMPLAVLAALLAPLGLDWLALKAMAPAINWIMGVAKTVSALDGAVGHVPTPPDLVLPLIALGGLVAILLRGRERLTAAVPILAAGLMWVQVERPPILISDKGGLVGLMTGSGRDMSKPKGEGFAARSWIENDGEAVTQKDAYARGGFGGSKGYAVADVQGVRLVSLTGRGAADRLALACDDADLVVVSTRVKQKHPTPEGCQVLDAKDFARSGALALWPQKDGFRIVSANERRGHRLWAP